MQQVISKVDAVTSGAKKSRESTKCGNFSTEFLNDLKDCGRTKGDEL
jgi:hypothetical protein